MLERYGTPVPVTGHVWGQPSRSTTSQEGPGALAMDCSSPHPQAEHRCYWPCHSNVVMVLQSQLQDLGSEGTRKGQARALSARTKVLGAWRATALAFLDSLKKGGKGGTQVTVKGLHSA